MFDKRVLFVQPDTELFFAAKEAEGVINLLDANLLSGDVHVDDLIERVRSIQPHLIIISSHGRDDGILLSDGIIDPSNLKRIFSTSNNLECVYLNTCSSVQTAIKIHRVLPVEFIFSLADVPDLHAYVSMSTFAYHLSQGDTYGSAWFQSKGGNGSDFMYLPNMIRLQGDELGDDMPSREDRDVRPKINGDGRLDNIHDEVVQLGYLIYGNEKWNLPGLVNSVASLQRDVSFIRTAIWLLVLLVFLLLIGLVIIWIGT